MSTFQQGQATADKEREDRRSLKGGLHFFLLGRQRISVGLSQVLFVKRYRWLLLLIPYIYICFIGILFLRNRFAH